MSPCRLAALARQVCATAAPGTLILAPHDHFLAQRDGFPAQKIAGCIYTVGLTKAEIETWRKDAEHTDLHPVTRPENLAHDIGYWSPILRAATFDFLRT